MLTLFKPYGSVDMEKKLYGDLVRVVGVTEPEGPLRDAEIQRKIQDCHILQADVDINVNKDFLKDAKELRAVLCTSIGVDYVNLEEMTEMGIPVANSPDFCIEAVAEYAIGLMFAVTRQIPRAALGVASGNWAVRRLTGGIELQGKTLGIIGFGRIGREVARMARALGLHVIVYQSHVKSEVAKQFGVETVSLMQICREADIVSIHAPLTEETYGLLDESAFAEMKEGVYLVNVSRGGIIVEKDLVKAIEKGKVGGVALDVLEQEPPDENHPLLGMIDKNVIITPHTAWNTFEAEQKADYHFKVQLEAVCAGEMPPSLLNESVRKHPRVAKWQGCQQK